MSQTVTDFIEFPPRDTIVSSLRKMEDSSAELEDLYETIGDRLGDRTYERSASAFILIELVYDFEEGHEGEWSYILPQAIMTLTEDRDLALTALSAFNEIKDAIGPAEVEEPAEAEPSVEPEGTEGEPVEEELTEAELETRELFDDEDEEDGVPETPPEDEASSTREIRVPSEADLLMSQLQNAQKALSDMGLGTRVSIDLATRRSTKERVSRTLQDISALRTALRRFEELLSRAELMVLESAGLLWENSKPRPEDDEGAGAADDREIRERETRE
ncbi:MAG: hypothetical protein R3234_06135 [Thermoanaerobaculia bacterium]|nr:hypothetical protein [Thermoanaerobaculia bacterium]